MAGTIVLTTDGGASTPLGVTIVDPGVVGAAGEAVTPALTLSAEISAGALTVVGQSLASSISTTLGAGAITAAGQAISTDLALSMTITAGAVTVAGQTVTPSVSGGAQRFVRQGASGSGTGLDWTNAYTTLPSSLTRGTTYYIADGSYSGYVFDDAASGTDVITIKKATTDDHGTETGWVSTYGDGQAVFGESDVLTDYYVIDGQRRNADWQQGAVSEYGFKFQGAGGKVIRLDNGGGSGGDHLVFRYIDAVGNGRDSGDADDVIYSLVNNTDVTFEFCSLRDSDRTIFITAGGMTSWTVDHCYIARNTSTPAVHAEMISSWGSATDCTFSHNIIEDIEGTAIWAFINDGVADDWRIYGNVIFHTAAFHADSDREGITGSVFVANDASNDNFLSDLLYYNNTHWNIKGLWSGVIIQDGDGGNEVRNNIWHDCVRTANSFDGTTSHNLYYDTVQDNDSTPTKVVLSAGESDIFEDTAAKDFRLKVATAAGQTLGSPYNVDPNGVTRGGDGTWDRGAFEFTE